MALDLLMGTGGQVSIGNAAFLAGGAFATVWASRAGVPFPFDVIIGGFACAVGGFIVGLPALRIRGMYLALATLAAFYLADFVGQKYQDDTVGAAGFFLKPIFTGTISQQSASWAWLLLGVVAATIILFSWLRSGRSGRAWRMIRDHEVAASMMGIPVSRYKLMLFTITSAIIGIQGGLTAHFIGVGHLRQLHAYAVHLGDRHDPDRRPRQPGRTVDRCCGRHHACRSSSRTSSTFS